MTFRVVARSDMYGGDFLVVRDDMRIVFSGLLEWCLHELEHSDSRRRLAKKRGTPISPRFFAADWWSRMPAGHFHAGADV